MDLARGHRECYGGTVVAITGSSGKTTVKEMVADVLATKGPVERTPGNWNNDIGIPLGLLTMSREADCWVLEAGMNHPGELAPLFEVIRPVWGIVTNVGPVHLEFFDNVAAIAVEKAALVRALPPEGGLVLSVDGAWTDVLLQDAVCRVVRVSMHEAVDAAYLGQPREGALVTFSGPEDSCECTMPLPGDYVVQDALLAYALGRELGVPAEAASQALAHYHPLALRWNRSERDGRIFINDAYNANPMSMRAALRAFRQVPAEHHWLVLGGMLELGDTEREEHLSLGREIAYGSWRGLLTVGQPGDVIAEGAESEGFAAEQTVRCETPEMAARVLADRMQPGDAALLKASRSVGLEGVLKAWPDDA
jgi:UDP-N-acetylmuramoyl-tripeptide--D-alanyl-D-alanine ligase